VKAVVSTGGKQFKVREGDLLELDLTSVPEGETIDLEDVLLVEREGEVMIGQPSVKDAKVTVRVVGETKGEKIRVFKHRRRKHHRKTMGHRQKYTQVRVENISVA